jgi:hypothetical protein
MTSPDGITWTARSASEANEWLSICWSPELSIFVAVATSGTNRVMTSAIGMPNSKSVVKALPSQMSVDANGNITTSAGYPYYQSLGTEKIVNPPSTTRTVYGVNITAMNKRTRASYASAEACVSTWTARSASDANSWLSVCWSPELSIFVAVAQNGTNRVMTSPDGITWTARSTPSGYWNSVCWSPELSIFVAVAYSGTYKVMTSQNGITWTTRSPAEDNDWRSVCWSPELSIFVAVATSGTNLVMTSTDGITWTARSAAEDNDWRSVCWSPELSIFVAVASSGTNRVMTSPDGITWTARSAAEANDWFSVCWSPELSIFVAVAYTGTDRVMTSPDGITWTARSAAEDFRSVCWSPELSIFVAVSYSGTNQAMTSPDGITWTARSTPSGDWYSVCWSPELSIFVTVAYGGTNPVMTSAIGMPNSKSVVKALPSQMSVDANGNVGIGTTASSSYKLDVNGTGRFTGEVGINTPPRGDLSLDINQTNYLYGLRVKTNSTSSNHYSAQFLGGNSTGMTVLANGAVGIGTTSGFGSHSLRIVGNPGTNNAQIYATGANYGLYISNITDNTYTRYSAYFGGGVVKVDGYYVSSGTNIGIRSQYQVYSAGGFGSPSDRRIKTDIVDVPDNLALTYVRNIPCYYYKYIDRPNKTKTIGFIAQEVKEVFPMAVFTISSCIPNIMQTVSGEWIEREDGKFDFSSHFFMDISFGTYKFRLREDISSENHIEKEVSMNDDRSFTFEKIYYDVFCYGIEVDDFNALDKSKLFALNFSATQEIDRIQQQHIIDISNAQATIQQHETTIQQQQLEIENLKLINQDMNNQLNMIKEHLGL